MHLSLAATSTILAFCNIVNSAAIPKPDASQLLTRAFTPQPNDPSMTPVDVRDLASDATMTCGGTTFGYKDIYKAVQWAIILEAENLGRGKKSNDVRFKNGRFPHSYDDTTYSFNGNCPADENREEYPLIKDGPYNGGLRNTQYGDHRVIYYSNGGEAPDGNPIAYFCGGITHEGATEEGKFLQCTVN